MKKLFDAIVHARKSTHTRCITGSELLTYVCDTNNDNAMLRLKARMLGCICVSNYASKRTEIYLLNTLHTNDTAQAAIDYFITNY